MEQHQFHRGGLSHFLLSVYPVFHNYIGSTQVDKKYTLHGGKKQLWKTETTQLTT